MEDGPMNRRILIAALPADALKPTDFEMRTGSVPVPGPGQVLVRTTALTIGAGQRAGLQGSASYAGTPEAGRLMGGTGIGTVEASNHPGIAAGAVVRADTGWQDYSVHDGDRVGVVDASIDAAHHLGVLGTNGLTAYFGLVDIGRPQAGETVVVSAAAGSVGHVVGQVATILGAQAVGVVGSDEKAQMLVDRLGFHAAINRRADDFRTGFKAVTPNRIDVYFDNTGGAILESALFRMNLHGRIVCCGAASQYDTSHPGAGPRGVPGLLVNNRVRMEGFLVFDYATRYEEARRQLRAWMDEGRLRPEFTEYQGLEQAPQAFVDLLGGVTVGTTIVRV